MILAICAVVLCAASLVLQWLSLAVPYGATVDGFSLFFGSGVTGAPNTTGMILWIVLGLVGAAWIVLSLMRIRFSEIAGVVFGALAIVIPAITLGECRNSGGLVTPTFVPYAMIGVGAISLIFCLVLLLAAFGFLNGTGEIHIAKRSGIPTWKAWVIRGAAILIALLLCAVITIIITKMNPATVLTSMFNGTFSVARKRWITLYRVAILLGISLAVTPAFKMRFWNIGAEGQVLIGAFAAAACMFYAGRMPFFNDPTVSMTVKNLILFPCMLIAAVGAGALWGFLPAFFKSRWNTNETLFTLMMNYVALQIVKFMIAFRGFPEQYLWSANGTSVGNINSGFASFGIGTFPKIADKPGTQYLIPIAIIGLLTIVLFTYLRYSKQGYEISVVGESERTASYAGIKVNRVIVRTMILSGALCGLVGFLIVGAEGTISHDVVDGRGYTAVMVSWMSQFNPIGMLFSSLLLVFMQFGAKEVAMPDGVSLDKNFANMLMSIILFFIISCEFFINYKLHYSRHGKKEA